MDSPRQKKIYPTNMVETLTAEWKSINRLRVLPLNPRISSWNYDAKNCCRIYARMVKAQAIAPRLVPLMARWAELLLMYAKHYGISDRQGYILGRSPRWAPQSLWLLPLLRQIESRRTIQDCHDRPMQSFNVGTWESEVKTGRCHILHRELTGKNLVVYRTVFADGSTTDSSPVGSRTFQNVRNAVQSGLNRHRAPSVRRALIQEIEDNHVKNSRYHARRDRVYS